MLSVPADSGGIVVKSLDFAVSWRGSLSEGLSALLRAPPGLRSGLLEHVPSMMGTTCSLCSSFLLYKTVKKLLCHEMVVNFSGLYSLESISSQKVT